ncbi:HAMP domain-containing sensor histidine kinase [Sphingobium sp. AP49]|uniref:sensor histidine kinase n=1 Tax=Sphingobium sp. AP49 TaxID=1144307 RepID=UPI001EE63D2F|nr:HAMP domain-containing sensor histidine kinase [Sphingobium sp. AP49]WHO40925.1 HAMP domain-containing sensor histidine kinase [Sphingobium sp. AP49]
MQTVLAAENRGGLGAVTLWRQCVDLLAQHDRYDRPPMMEADRDALLDRLDSLRGRVSEVQRIATVVELGGRLRSPSLIRFFANDRPSIAAAAMARAQLADTLWAQLLPQLTPTARGVLRGRRDMGAETRHGLEAFGPADLVLTVAAPVQGTYPLPAADIATSAIVEAPALLPMARDRADAAPTHGVVDQGQDQIRNLVDRIARFTSTRRPTDATDDVAPARATEARAFAFETDAAGLLVWVDQGPRAALVGLSLGEMPLEGASGPDGHVAGAFQRRSGFQNGRFTIVGGAMEGEWRLSATPFFDPRSGRFQGYRGQARRPYLHEVAATPPAGPVTIAGLSADSLRQLVHELRTPLNAILGFAEIIEQELFGAAGPEYREMAGNIAVDARHLLAAFDDLDLAAKVSRGDAGGALQAIDPALLVMQVAARFRDQGGDAGTPIDIVIAPDLPQVSIDPVQGERMIQHLLRTLISVAPVGEAVTGACWFQPDGGGGRVVLSIDRPSTLAGMEEAHLLDPGYTPDGDWADGPLLGLGFSLRLIRSLAAGCGGSLDIEAGRVMLVIPAQVRQEDAAGNA